MDTYIVYRHISPNNKVYIGITSKTTQERRRNGKGYSNCILFNNTINKYGWDNIKHEVIYSNLQKQDAIMLEIKLISIYKKYNISLNITDGGEGNLGTTWTPSKDVREKWSKQRKGKVIPKEQREKISKTLKGRVLPKEQCIKGAQVIKEKYSKRIIQFTKDGKLLQDYYSLREASRITGIDASDISRCCRNKANTAGNYKWIYKEDYAKESTII